MPSAENPTPIRILAIDDTPSILADYRRIFCTPASAEARTSELTSLEAELFGGEAIAPRTTAWDNVELVTSASGEEGLERVKAAIASGQRFDIAFVDMRMPGGWDGFQTIRQLFATDPGIQVVIATAYSDRGLQEIGTSFRRNDQLLILKKPFDSVEVRQAALALAAKRRMTEAAEIRMEELERRVDERTEQLRRIALEDNLTGLPNRRALLEKLEATVAIENKLRASETPTKGLETERRDRRGFALLFLDFNRFKVVNDSLGHDVGDQLLQSIAERIRGIEAEQMGTEGCPVSGPITGHRLGGDEFILLLEGVPCVGAAGDVALRVMEAFEPAHELGVHRCVSQPSIGMACSFRERLDAGELLRDADLAMFEAKAQGRISGKALCVAYEGAMHRNAQRRLTLENDLRDAIAEDRLDLCYQPIHSAHKAEIVGVEALLSWTHPTLGQVKNTEIIAVANETDLIDPLGVWVRKTALAAAARLQKLRSGKSIPLHVNVSMRELLRPEFAAAVTAQTRKAGLATGALVLEVSEIGMDRQSESVAEAIKELDRHGLPVILDDFGRERSSLAFLAELPLRAVKIDRFFASDIEGHAARLQVLHAIVGFAKSLSLGTTACGIETPEQLAAVQSIGVDEVQGFLTGRPVTLEALLEAIEGNAGSPPFRAAA